MAREDKSKAAAGKKDEGGAPQKKKGKGMLVVIVAAVGVLAAGGGGAAWWFMRGQSAAPAQQVERPKPTVYVPLETFTVNLLPENGDRYLQTTLSLSVTAGDAEHSIKQKMPEIRSRLLLLLSSKKPSDLASIEGKQKLANQIAAEVNGVVSPPAPQPATQSPAASQAAAPEAGAAPAPTPAPAPVTVVAQGPVQTVLFTDFIIQ